MKNIKIKNCSLVYFEKDDLLIPALDFEIERQRFLGSDEVSLYFDGKKYFGNKIGIENDEVLSDEEVKFYSDYITNYNRYITCSENITKALTYFYENKLCTTFLKFLANTEKGYLNWLNGIDG